MADLIIGDQLHDYMEFSALYGMEKMQVYVEDMDGENSRFMINKDQAIQIIEHLKNQFEL